MSSGRASSARSAGATASAGSARLPTITGWTNSTATWRASERAAGEAPSAIRRPPRANRSAIWWQSRAIRSASASKNRAFAVVRRSSSASSSPPEVKGRVSLTPAPSGSRFHALGNQLQPLAEAVDALARAGADQHVIGLRVHLPNVVQEQVEVEVEMRQVDLVDQHQLARPEH